MDGGQTLAFLCKAVCVFVGVVHRFRLWDSVSGKLGGEGKHISAEGDSIPVFLICCIISWINWRGPHITLQAYRGRAVSKQCGQSFLKSASLDFPNQYSVVLKTTAPPLPDREDCGLPDMLPGWLLCRR